MNKRTLDPSICFILSWINFLSKILCLAKKASTLALLFVECRPSINRSNILLWTFVYISPFQRFRTSPTDSRKELYNKLRCFAMFTLQTCKIQFFYSHHRISVRQKICQIVCYTNYIFLCLFSPMLENIF